MQFRFTFLFLAVLAFTPATSAGWPAEGIYTSTDIGGTMLPGRYSVSWTHDAGYGAGGNVLRMQSWDGVSLGTQWSIQCPILSSSEMLSDSVDAEGHHHVTGSASYYTFGSTVVLDGSGPWGGAPETYAFDFHNLDETVTLVGTDMEILSFTAVETGVALASADHYYAMLTIEAMTRTEEGNTDTSLYDPLDHPFPYPLFVGYNCDGERNLGTWGSVTAIRIEINTIVPTETTTWGRIKSLYRE